MRQTNQDQAQKDVALGVSETAWNCICKTCFVNYFQLKDSGMKP